MKFDYAEYSIGTWAISALVNGDYSGLSDAEEKMVTSFEIEALENFGPGHWATTDEHDEFGRDDVTGSRGAVETVRWMFPIKSNPKGRMMATKKPSAAQIAARERFAEMARSGAFTKRKRNPLTRVKQNSPSMATGDAPSKRLKKRRKATAAGPPGYYANPLTRVKTNSPSMATGEPPSKRLKKRRKATATAPPGYYANPRARYPDLIVPMPNDSEPLHAFLAIYVQWFNTVSGQWRTIAAFANGSDAQQYARAFSKTARGESKTIRVAAPER